MKNYQSLSTSFAAASRAGLLLAAVALGAAVLAAVLIGPEQAVVEAGVPAGAELGLPATAADVQATTEDFVDVAHREGHVVQCGVRARR